MQSSEQAVCLNMQPCDGHGYGYGKDSSPSFSAPARSLAVQQHKDYILWSLFNFAFLNCCCLGFSALVFSIKSRDRKVVGDPDGAASYGKTAKCLNITALVVSLIFTAVFLALVFYSAATLGEQFQEMLRNRQ